MAVCSACGAASNPGDRFCAQCGAALEQRCPTCGTVLPDDARFCPACGTAIATSEAAGPVDHTGEERKIVSVLFADLVGFTASSDGADPEDMRRRLQPYHTALRQEVERFGGRIEKLMGDGVLAVFGVPAAHEDDAERAVRAGLRIQEAIAELAGASELQARVAIGTGEAVVLVEGTTMDREGIVGDVVNTASRLQNEAPPGSVLVEEATHRATQRIFQYEERPPVAVKGKRNPLSVWIALRPTGRFGADIEDDGATLVGRTSELALIVDAFTRAVQDQTSQLVTIGGEPGVGKSRMVRELRRHIDDLPDLTRWRQGRCLPYGEGITYWALGEIVKAEAGIFETDTPATALGKLGACLEALLPDADERSWVAGRLAPLVGSDQEAPADRAERFAAWYRYAAALGEQRSTVLVIEDLQWADQALVDFLSELPEATRGIPLLLVCTARPDFFETHPEWGGGQRNAVTVRLEPLDAAATGLLLDELLEGEDLDREMRQTIADRSGGNPLWAQEFVRMLHDRPADLAIPDTVQAVVASRIDLLDHDTKTAIQAASTIGKSFWVGAVAAALHDPPDLEAGMRELARRELIRRQRVSTVSGETEYAFTHSVVRDVAYSQTPRAVRAERHHRVARWIERMAGDRVSDRAEVIAHHDAEALRLAVATDIPDVTLFTEAAIASHRRAAEQAARLDVNAQRGHLEAALELVPSGDGRRGQVLFDLGKAYGTAGVSDAATKALLEARQEFENVGDIEGWGKATSTLSTYAWVSSDPDEANAFLDEAISRLEDLPPGEALAAAYSQRAGVLWLRGDSTAEARKYIAGVRHVVEVHGDLEARRRILSADGGSRFDAGDPTAVDPFRQVLRMAIESDDSMGIGSGHLNLGEQLRTGWGTHEAISVHERGLEVALQRGLSGAEQFLRGSLAEDYFLKGQWDEALEMVEAGLAIPERFSYVEGAFVELRLEIEAYRGDTRADSVERVEELVEKSEALKDLQAVIPSYDGAMSVRFMYGDDEAVTYARKIVDRSGATRYLIDAFPLTVFLLRRAGELDRIGALLPDLRRFEMPRPQALMAVLDALLLEESDPAAALTGLEQAVADLAGLGVAVEAVVALSDAVRIATSLGDEAGAEALRDRAGALLDGAGAEPFLEMLGMG